MWQLLQNFEFTGRFLVGMGALLAGLGSLFSGIAAIKKAREEGKKEAQNETA